MNGIVLNVPIGHKSRLERKENFGQDKFQPISQDFSNELVNNVAKTNRPKLVHNMGTTLFRDKGNVGVILFFQKMVIPEKIPNALQHVLLDSGLVLLIKKGCKVV
jgi:hypothetical protein